MILGTYRIRDGTIHPQYLGPADLPWLVSTLEEYARFAGKPVRTLRERWTEPLAVPAPRGKHRLVVEMLDRLVVPKVQTPASPRLVRKSLCLARAASSSSCEQILVAVSREFGLNPQEVRSAFFADLPGERTINPLPPDLTGASLIPRANLEIVQRLLRRATRVTIRVSGRSLALVRAARSRGLLCSIEESPARGARDATMEGTAVLGLSGPLAVIRRTILYGRALAGLAPILPWCGRFALRASCLIEDELLRFELRAGDVELPGREPRRFDSRLEERFYQEFTKLAPDWNVFREAAPIRTPRGLIFPDFLIQHRQQPARRWWLEIVGFWTPEYLERKLAGLREARLDRLILCLDADRACGTDDFPPHGRILRFRRRIDATEVLRLLDTEAP